MKILFVSPRVGYPMDTGAKIRTTNLLRGLTKKHEVTLLTFAEPGKDKELENFSQGTKEVYTAPQPPIGNVYDIIRLAASAIGSYPLSVQRYSNGEMSHLVRKLARKNDLVHFDHIHTSQYIEDASDAKVSIDEHNVEWIIADRMSKSEKSQLKKIVYAHQALVMKSYEKNRICKSDLATCCSEIDAQNLKTLSGKDSIEVIPNGVDIKFFSQQTEPVDENHIVFTGSMDWMPNVEGVLWFHKEVFPLLKSQMPKIKIYIVGRSPLPELKQLHNPDDFIITGTVPDVRPYYKDALALVVPLLAGGGTRLKILEAMAANCPVITTTVGGEGIEYENGIHALVADSPQDFVNCIKQLQEDKKLKNKLIDNGASLVKEKYSWEHISETLADIYTNKFGQI